ncbi:malonic semialdehyde reductase [Marinomonas sp. TW1]|uniref:malonic semialdehyde reductase n=1 Tax=Marinomonas sp. TW1 TaxID=1561203 RepID=UPI0007AF5226|nr:malonic semialdehyde reductase [Marinomonas sp. TW1]KZN13084.1 malonic semialdehyde reductase [Marinomonas sp. TW1]
MSTPLDKNALDQLFLEARTYNEFLDTPVNEETIKALYDLCKWGPTSMNTQPARFVFLNSTEGKERLLPALAPGNVEKTRGAPLTLIVASDSEFYQHLPTQFPVMDAKPMFENDAALSESTAFRNSSLQGAYVILAARALGLAAGPMSGFNPAAVDAEFFADGRFKTNFIINLGYGKPEGYHPRGPRLDFEEAAKIL